ncbi:MAG: energy-coupling factor transporter ATPase, partial [Clostridia bacterium]|nr:energy-coupling factor transporter ATPase [Clostridia bacterium]
MEDVARIAGRIIVMNQGKIDMDGKVAEVFGEAERLRAMGLDVPQVSRLVKALKERGIPIDENIYTIEKAKAAIMLLMKDKREA